MGFLAFCSSDVDDEHLAEGERSCLPGAASLSPFRPSLLALSTVLLLGFDGFLNTKTVALEEDFAFEDSCSLMSISAFQSIDESSRRLFEVLLFCVETFVNQLIHFVLARKFKSSYSCK